MKGHMRKHKATGGSNEAEMDLKDKPTRRVNAPTVEGEAEERKRGGRTERKRGGKTVEMEGEKAKMHAGRKPRKSGGSCDSNPFTSARHGKEPAGRKVDGEMDGL